MDYEALAKEFGGVVSSKGGVDYEALAKEFGGEINIPLAAVPEQALRNAPASAAKFAGDIYTAVTNPVQTVTGLADLAAGALRAGAKQVLPEKAFQFLDQLDTPETTKRISDTANAVGGELASRYGSYESIKRTVATDPVGALADLSTLATGGAMATARRAPGVSNVMAQAAAKTDPLMMGVRAGVNSVNALRSAAAAAPNPRDLLNAAIAPYVDPGAVATNRFIKAVEDPAAAAAGLRATQNALVTPGAPPLSASERLIEAGTPSLGLSALEQNLAQASPQAAQTMLGREQQRAAAIQQQLTRVENQIQTQAAALKPADLTQLRQVRDTLMRELADEQATLANTAQVVPQPLPTVRQADVGGQVQARGQETAAQFQRQTVSPAYTRAFEAAGGAPIDLGRSMAAAERFVGDIGALVDPTKVSPAVRNLLRLDADPVAGPPVVSLEDFQSVRAALNKQYAAASRTDPARANALQTVIRQMDADLAASPVPREAVQLYREANRVVREEQIPRFRTGETGKMLSQGQRNMPGTLPSQQVAAFLKNEDAAAQFVRTFESDPRALQSLQQGVLDLYRRDIVDPATRSVDPAKSAAFEAKYARQLDTLEAAGLNVRETMGMVQRDATAVQQALDTLAGEAKKFGKAKSADAVVDLALKSPMDMKFVRDRLTPTAREALSGEIVNRATSAIERGDPTAALAYLTKNEKAIKVGLGKEGAKTYDELVSVARLQEDVAKISAQAPKTDILTPVKLAQAYTPEQLTNLQVVVEDLRRMRQTEQMGAAPGVSAKRAATEMAEEAGSATSRFPGWFSPTWTAIKSAGKNILGRMDRKATAAMMELAINNPDKLIPLLEEAAKAKTAAAKFKPQPLTIPVGVERAARGATALGAAQNAMGQDNQNAMAR